jgi:hypothetical protein
VAQIFRGKMVEQGRQRAAIISVAVSALDQPERLDRSPRR